MYYNDPERHFARGGVIEALDRFWRNENANVHRGVYTLSEEATTLYERARHTVARHIGAEPREVIFTRNATEGINLVANSWGRANLGPGDRVLVTELEHHSNIVPWYLIARERGAELDWAPLTGDGRLDIDAFRSLLERGPKLVAVAHVSNVLGTVNPIAEIARLAHDAGAVVLVDGAQAAPKMALDVGELRERNTLRLRQRVLPRQRDVHRLGQQQRALDVAVTKVGPGCSTTLDAKLLDADGDSDRRGKHGRSGCAKAETTKNPADGSHTPTGLVGQ